VEEGVATVGVFLAAFVSTNVDNLFLLVGLLAATPDRPWRVHAGFVAAIAAIVVAGILAAQLADFLPLHLTGWLGVVPIGLGLFGVFRLVREGESAVESVAATATGIVPVALITLANAGDSFSVFLPLFADTADGFLPAAAITVIVASLLWCALATWMLSHAAFGARLQREAPRILPFLMIAVGIYVLLNTGTDPV